MTRTVYYVVKYGTKYGPFETMTEANIWALDKLSGDYEVMPVQEDR